MREINCKCIGMLSGGKWDRVKEQNRRVYSADYILPTLTTCGGGNQEVKIMEPQAIHMVRSEQGKRLRKKYESHEIKCGFNEHRMAELKEDGCCNTLSTVQKDNLIFCPNFRVRKLTPKECWRLMGFDDDSFERAEKVNSNSQLYKQAGNSIVVDVLMAIFKEMLP